MIVNKPVLLLIILLIFVFFVFLYFINFSQPVSQTQPICGNDILEKGEQCEKTSDCALISGKTALCDSSCQCQYSDVEPTPSGAVCGNKLVEGGEDCDPPGSVCSSNGKEGRCSSQCGCETSASQNGECPPDKDVPWVKYCLPALGGSVEGVTRGDNPGYVACIPITLEKAHNQNQCKDVRTVDPACDTWKGCNAKECKIYQCNRDTIPCFAHYHYVPVGSGSSVICRAEITYSCEAECNCVEDKDADYISCPPVGCEEGCPYISAPAPSGGGNQVNLPGTGGVSN